MKKLPFAALLAALAVLSLAACGKSESKPEELAQGDTDALTAPEDSELSLDGNIPPSIDGIPVTAIGEQAFYHYSSLTGITLPDSVTAIGDGAFRDCYSHWRWRIFRLRQPFRG
jgi:hypothetical protein